MSLRFLADENFNADIVRGLLLQQPNVDIVSVQHVGIAGYDDPEVLEWAAQNNRILLTHDRATMPDFAYERLTAGQAMPGLFVLNDRFPVGQAIQELLLMAECSEQAEWIGKAVHVPL